MTTDLTPVDDDLDGFYDEAPAGPVYGIQRGRYVYPAPPGYTIPKGDRGFMRMTNLAAAFSDQIRLQKWRERMIMLGLRTEEGEVLYDELAAAGIEQMTPEDAKAFLETMAEKIADAAGAGLGARRGTARHTMLQVFHESGVITGHRTMRLQLHSLHEALEAHYLRPLPGWSERRVCNTRYGVMGTLDLGVECLLTGQRGILDLKTQRRFWTFQEIAGQQHGYDSAEWVWDGPPDPSGSWLRPRPWDLTGAVGGDFEGRRVALLAHMPPHMPQAQGPQMLPVEIHEVALDYGAEVMTQARENVRLRSIGASTAKGRRVGARRPVPSSTLKVASTLG
jgi:hypothetical protein